MTCISGPPCVPGNTFRSTDAARAPSAAPPLTAGKSAGSADAGRSRRLNCSAAAICRHPRTRPTSLPSRVARRTTPWPRRSIGPSSRDAGWPADARHCGQGGRVQAGRRARPSARTSAGPSRTPGSGRDARRTGRPGRLRRHGQPPHARRRDAARGDRQGGRAPPRRDRDHGQQERDPVRHAARRHRIRHPDRDAGRDDPRLRPGRDARYRPDDHRGDPAPRRSGCQAMSGGRGPSMVSRFPVPGLPAA